MQHETAESISESGCKMKPQNRTLEGACNMEPQNRTLESACNMKPQNRTLEGACKEFEADLVLYYYGDDSEADHLHVQRHCSECSRCGRFLDDLHQFLPQMAQPREMPESFWDNYYHEVVQKLALERQQPSWWREFLES